MRLVLEFQVNVKRNKVQTVDTLAVANEAWRRAIEISPDFELWVVQSNLQNGKFHLEKDGRTMRSVAALNPSAKTWLNAGDVVLVGYYHRNRQRPYIKADAPLGRGKVKPSRPRMLPGFWPTSQGPLSGSRLTTIAQPAQQEFPVFPFLIEVGPSAGGADILGLVAYDQPSGEVALAIYCRKDAGAGQLQNCLSAHRMDGTQLWQYDIGDPYTAPASPSQDETSGSAQTWLHYDPTAMVFWVVNHGSLSQRKSLEIIRNDGTTVTGYGAGVLLSQCTAAGGTFFKGWHSRRPPTGREEDEPNLTGFVLSGNTLKNWSIDPETLLPGVQLATSSATVRGGFITPEGRWPVTSDGLVLVWLSGSVPFFQGKTNVIAELYTSGGSASDMCAAQSATVADDAKCPAHKATLVAIELDTGKLAWRRDWNHEASHKLDALAYSGWVAAHTYTPPFPGSTPQPPAPGVAPYYEFKGGAFWPGFWVDRFTFSGFAAQNSLALEPQPATGFPSCSGIAPPVYQSFDYYFQNWFGPGWSPGFGGQFEPSACGAWAGPHYDFFVPGHIRLLPLPADFRQWEQAAAFDWPDHPETTRRDPVGGIHVDSTDKAWHAILRQSDPILRDFKLQGQYRNHSEDFVASPDPDQCGSWINRFCDWDAFAVGLSRWHPIILLCCTGPKGQPLFEVDISQYFSCPIGWSPAGLPTYSGVAAYDRTPLANVWQVLAIPECRVVIVVRDWFDGPEDLGALENWPHPTIELRDYQNPQNVLQRIPLFDDLTTYDSNTDPELDPIITRVWDHYNRPSSLSEGKGAPIESGGYWIQWSHLVRNRQTSEDKLNRVQLRFPANGQSPSVDRWLSSGGLNLPDSREKSDTMVLAGGKVAWVSRASNANGYFVTVV